MVVATTIRAARVRSMIPRWDHCEGYASNWWQGLTMQYGVSTHGYAEKPG
jgi:hypothetical protein